MLTADSSFRDDQSVSGGGPEARIGAAADTVVSWANEVSVALPAPRLEEQRHG
jgi:hypothetical protein